jgi:serine/threonine protein kinase
LVPFLSSELCKNRQLGNLKRENAGSSSHQKQTSFAMGYCLMIVFIFHFLIVTIIEEINHGAFGIVYKASKNSTDEIVAIKQERVSSAVRESEFWKRLSEWNLGSQIVKFYNTFSEKEDIFFVMEYCKKGSLQDFMNMVKKHNIQCIPESVFIILIIFINYCK